MYVTGPYPKPNACIPPYFPKIHSNIFLPSMLKVLWVVSSLQVFQQKVLCISNSFHVCCMSCSSHPPWLNHPNNIWWSIQVIKFLTVKTSQPPTTSSSLGPNFLLSTLFSHITVCSSPSVKDQVSHPYKTTCKIIVLYKAETTRQKILNYVVASTSQI
jgi:hypothetical protein